MADDGQLRTDVHTPEQRSFNMSRIRSRDTKPELQLRRGLHAAGLRFRLDAQDLPGRPDLVFPRHRAVAFVHGCFWHGHDCPLFKLPVTRTEFWTDKIQKNRARDARATTALRAADWRVLTVWECAFRGPFRLESARIIEASEAFLRGSEPLWSLAGRTPLADSDVGRGCGNRK